jgi:hypothetical protein
MTFWLLTAENGNAAHAREGGAAFGEREALPEFRIAGVKKRFSVNLPGMNEM